MNEVLIKSHQGAEMLESDLREALDKADPVEVIVIRQLLAASVELTNKIKELCRALEGGES